MDSLKDSLRAFTLIELLVVISIIAILAGIALPVFSQVQEKGAQTKALSNAKQIGLACRLYASDHDGRFPTRALDVNLEPTGDPVDTSNEAFAQLIPDYIQTESIFAVGKSKWSEFGADEQIDSPQLMTPSKTLKGGENHWAYMLGMSDTSNAAYPLIADGFKDGTVPSDPAYTNDETDTGGVWKGKKAIVIRVDNSGSVEKCDSTFKVMRTSSTGKKNLFKADPPDWMGKDNEMVNPKKSQS